MTSRGSRFKDGAMRNPAGQVFMKGRVSTEWLTQNIRSTRNFIRKWGHMVKHDEMMKPIIPPKYDIGFVVHNCDANLLKELEPWCSSIYVEDTSLIVEYITEEQKNTDFDLTKRGKPYIDKVNKSADSLLKLNSRLKSSYEWKNHNILVEFDAQKLNANNFQHLVNLSEIMSNSGEIGKLELEIFKFNVKSLESYEKDLILVK